MGGEVRGMRKEKRKEQVLNGTVIEMRLHQKCERLLGHLSNHSLWAVDSSRVVSLGSSGSRASKQSSNVIQPIVSMVAVMN